MHQLKKALAALATMLCMTTGAHAADDFLDPADAFRVSASLDASGTAVQVAVEVAPGYHLYADSLRLTGERDVRFGAMRRPAGEVRYDEALKKPREQYAGTVAIVAPVYGAAGAFELAVDSQGCADSGLCYPPTTTRVALSLPRTIAPADGAARTVAAGGPADASAAAGGGTGSRRHTRQDDHDVDAGMDPDPHGERVDPGPRSVAVAVGQAAELDRIASTLARGDLLSSPLLFAGLGALLSLTPCVLPMVPILSAIIVGQGGTPSRGRGLALSASYSLGMAVVYTSMGVAAGLAGEGLAAALQQPWVLMTFAGLLFLLALSMFAVYVLQMPGGMQSRLQDAANRLPGGRLASVFVMGGLSSLIVGPCVAAPLAGALVYIGQSRDVLAGGVALFAMSCGMSLPLLACGVSAGSLLPKAGAWMDGVKRFFGVLLIGVSIWMVSPVVPPIVAMLAWGVLAVLSAVWLGVLEPLPAGARGTARLAKGVGAVLAVAGVAQLAGAMGGGRDPAQPLATFAPSAGPVAAGAATRPGGEAGGSFRRGAAAGIERHLAGDEAPRTVRAAGARVLRCEGRVGAGGEAGGVRGAGRAGAAPAGGAVRAQPFASSFSACLMPSDTPASGGTCFAATVASRSE
ncbi:MAG TPA: protein-disulfide reductase DsbD [Burkholderiaceae bacterium]|nr:protein-disulfide reductase DsbD [Burkholderiaceae bacterium]